MNSRSRLLELLDHREFHTGTALGAELGISRAAVHQHINRLKRAGLPIEAVPGRGYRLAQGVYPLRAGAILDDLDGTVRRAITRLLVEASVDSTSDCLRRLCGGVSLHGAVCIAEAQSSGRGRRGNRWVASPYRNLLMSTGWVYDTWPRGVTGLAIAVGVAIVDALADMGVQGPGLKWPNDIVVDGRKLGGILIDVDGESTGPCRLVVGVGINVDIAAADAHRIPQPWIDLSRMDRWVNRNRLAAACLNRLVPVLSAYGQQGFGPYRARWSQVDVLCGREVSVIRHDGGRPRRGTVLGLGESGGLRLRLENGVETTCFQGDVSVRSR